MQMSSGLCHYHFSVAALSYFVRAWRCLMGLFKKHKMPLLCPVPPLGSASNTRERGMEIQNEELYLGQPTHPRNRSFLPFSGNQIIYC